MKTIFRAYLLICVVLSVLVTISNTPSMEILEHRAPFIVVDIIEGKAIGVRDDGLMDGITRRGEYIAYEDVEVGTCVRSVFIYNPFNNYCDDIIARWDIQTWKP